MHTLMQYYVGSMHYLLHDLRVPQSAWLCHVQINSGNSGGPAFNTAGQCVGIAFQSLKHEDAENIAYIIPTPVIQHFINDW